MSKEEAIKYLKEMKDECNDTFHKVRYVTQEEALDMAIKALEQEPSGDLISREDVEECKELMTDINGDTVYAVRMSDIRQLPSVNPQEKTGHWILARTFSTKLYNEYLNEYECSECYRRIRCTESQLVNYPYCHCGAKIEPQVRSCSNCKYWRLDKDDENRMCKYCFDMDEWVAESEDKE